MEHKKIDAVDLVRQIRDDLYEKTKDLSTEELIAFYHHHAAETKERLSLYMQSDKKITAARS